MDPLSITVSIVSLLGAIKTSTESLDRIRSRKTTHTELLSTLNTITDLQATLMVVLESISCLHTSQAPGAQATYQQLPQFINKTTDVINELNTFIRDHLLKDGRVSLRQWNETNRRKLGILKCSVQEARQNLVTALNSANLRLLPGLLVAIQDIAIIEQDRETRISASLDETLSRLCASEQVPSASSISNSGDGALLLSTTGSSLDLQLQHEPSTTVTTQLRVKASLPSKTCDPFCVCQCHIRTKHTTPRWISVIFGSLFYKTSIRPSLGLRPCNSSKCHRSKISSSYHQFTYYFPTWLLRSALAGDTWKNLNGRNSSWTIRMPREIPYYSDCWHLIQTGNAEGIRDLLYQHEMSPFDVGPDGVSVLHWATGFWQLDICAMLLADGASWHFRDREGRAASDGAWVKVLMSGCEGMWAIRIRELLGPEEDLYELKLNSLHRIITKLSSVSLQKQLELDPSGINCPDWLGKTPLMWAALLEDAEKVQLLLAEGADLYLKDHEERTALNHAARSGCRSCVESLLAAGADPNSSDINGWSPFHDVVMSGSADNQFEAITSALIQYGGKINARSRLDGWTALYQATSLNYATQIFFLIKHGADVNALDYDNTPPIARAISVNHLDALISLCENDAQFEWTPTIEWTPMLPEATRNVLEEAALFASVEVINRLADTSRPLIKCSVAQIIFWFNEFRPDHLQLGAKASPEEELTALKRLLAKRAIDTGPGVITQDFSHTEDNSLTVSVPWESDNEGEIYEDALESLADTSMADRRDSVITVSAVN